MGLLNRIISGRQKRRGFSGVWIGRIPQKFLLSCFLFFSDLRSRVHHEEFLSFGRPASHGGVDSNAQTWSHDWAASGFTAGMDTDGEHALWRRNREQTSLFVNFLLRCTYRCAQDVYQRGERERERSAAHRQNFSS